jgi:tetratricopeptide (TPR) repeat protein
MSPLLRRDRQGEFVLSRQKDRGYATNDVAIAFSKMGRGEEAIELYQKNLQLCLDTGNPAELATGLRNLAISLRNTNKLASAARISRLAYDLAEAADDKESLARSILDQMVDASTNGKFEEAEAYFSSFRHREQSGFAIYRSGYAERRLATVRFFQGRLTAEDLGYADQVASKGRNLFTQHRLSALRAEWELGRGNPEIALAAIEKALAITRRIGAPAPAYLGLRALTLARLGQTSEARETLAKAEEIWNGRLPDFLLFAAETWLTLGEREQARVFVRQACPLAWADGPPHIHWYYLKRCRELMAELCEPEPQLPPFDPAKVEPIPYEAEIRALIEKLKAEATETNRGTRFRWQSPKTL